MKKQTIVVHSGGMDSSLCLALAIDEHGATTAHEFQIHVFHDPSSKQLVNTGWPLMLTFVGVVFAWGMSSL